MDGATDRATDGLIDRAMGVAWTGRRIERWARQAIGDGMDDESSDGRSDGSIHGWSHGWRWMDGWMDQWS